MAGPKRSKEAPAANAAEALHAGLATIFDSGELSDFELRCESHNFKVHKAILAIMSPVLKLACTGPFTEASQQYMDMPDDDPTYVQAMLHGIYLLDYDDTRDIAGTPVEPMLFNMHMYLITEKYDVESIRCMAWSKLMKNLGESGTRKHADLWWPNSKVKVFLAMLKNVFEITHSKRTAELQDTLVKVAFDHIGDLLRYDSGLLTLMDDKDIGASFTASFMPMFWDRVKRNVYSCFACGKGGVILEQGKSFEHKDCLFRCSCNRWSLERLQTSS